MPIDEQTLKTLEFPKIRERLARFTSFSASKELALALLPSTDTPDVLRRLRLTSEAGRFLDEFPEAGIGGARDIRPMVDHAARGGVLESGTFLEIGTTLGSMRRLRGMLGKLKEEHFPLLSDYGACLPDLVALEDAIAQTIGEDGTVLDRASPALHRLRNQIAQSASRLQDKLHSLISSPKYSSALQEPLITVRNGRHVVPVKADHRRVIPGLVHDQSSSGATLYVEPLSVVDLNNHWHECQIAEEQEVERILMALSDRIGSEAPTIIAGIETLALLDLAFAQSRYALALRCIEPELVSTPADQPTDTEQSPLMLTRARHPLLDQSSVVPIDVWLGGDFRLLLITGPNTGGKTVALKTVGLLALMAQAGLHIPANAPARLPVFAQVFADIGDEQSIEQSLSTFSSHMTTIIHILDALDQQAYDRDGNRPTLVLLDELGAGTDPVEGAALARAIIHRLLEHGCLGILTTHYAELKAFAYTTGGIQNASVEFDIETLAPTYRLMVGLPGRSNALAIAARLGLHHDVIELARSTITHEDAEVEDLLADIHHQREAAEAAMQRARELQEDAHKYRDRLAEELRELEDTRQERIEAAYQQAEDELRTVRAELRSLRDELRRAADARQPLHNAEAHLEAAEGALRTRKDAETKRRSEATRAHIQQHEAERPLAVGDTVLVRSVGLTGEILAIDEEDMTADVQVGGFRMNVSLRELRRDKGGKKAARTPPSYEPSASASLPAAPDVSMNFDMRGWRAAEASERLERYLNDAYMAGLAQVHLIHGKGSGVLRQVVRETLRNHPLVKSFSKGDTDANDGMTVVKLVER